MKILLGKRLALHVYQISLMSLISFRYLGAARSNRYLFIILEYISGGSIASMLQQFGAFSESLIRYAMLS